MQRQVLLKMFAVLSYGARSDIEKCYHTQTPAGARSKYDHALK